MFLKSNQSLNRILLHGRKNDQWVPLKHLQTHGLHDQMDWPKAADAGLLHMRKKERGYEVNLSQKGYHTLSNLYRAN
ncbi:hypothetical protein TCA2_4519 [Paenibacillus sp. TCA20]|nr:hypothetical protein TCA2_4519 [Paenibacillus sp. TCA20]